MEWLDKKYFTWWWDVNDVKKALFEYGGCRLKAAEYPGGGVWKIREV